jgi:four helix bundle protein
MAIERFEDIESWKLGRVISTHIDEMVKKTGLGSDFPLRYQMSRSAGSIMDNIAEGFDAGSNPEFVRFLWYAKRSDTELESQLYRALDRQYCSRIKFDELYALIRQTKAKIAALIRYLKDNKDPNKA